jgi:transcriptional regulator with XRE-family HTH domain
VARTKQPPISAEDRRVVGSLLRDLRKAAGYRSVDAAAAEGSAPSSRQTIYAYERGGLVPSLKQFMELVEFYALGRDVPVEARYQGVAAMMAALASPAYHFPEALRLIERLQPTPTAGRRRRAS